MTRILGMIWITLAVLVGLLVLAVAAINIVPGNQYKGLISLAVKSATGRELVIGDLNVELGSSVLVAASDVRLSNAEWGSRREMFSGRLIEGEVPLKPLLDGVLDLRLILESPDLLLERDADGHANWQLGTGVLEAEEKADTADPGEGPVLRTLLREVRLEEVKLAYVDAQADAQHEAEFETVRIRSYGNDVEVKLTGRLDGHALALTGGNDASAVSDATTPADFNLTGELGDIRLKARGKLDAISAAANVDLLLEAKAPSLATLSVFAGRDLPDQGPLNARLRLSGGKGRYSAQDIKLELDAELLEAMVEGAVADLTGASGIDLAVSAKTDRLPELVQRLGLELPGETPPGLVAEGKLQGSLKELALANYRLSVLDQGMEATVKGQVGNLVGLTGIQADLALETRSLSALSKYVATELPDTGPLQLSGTLTSPDGLDAPSEVSAVLNGDGVVARADGSVNDLLAAQGISLAIDIAGDSLAQVAKLAGQDLARKEPLSVTTQLHLDGATYKAEGLKLRLGDNEVGGVLVFTRPARQGEPARLDGELHLGELDLAALFGAVEFGPAQADGEAAQLTAAGGTNGGPETETTGRDGATNGSEKKADKVFPSDPLPLKALRSLDVDLDVTADELGTTQVMLERFVAKLTLKKGVLRLEPVNAGRHDYLPGIALSCIVDLSAFVPGSSAFTLLGQVPIGD